MVGLCFFALCDSFYCYSSVLEMLCGPKYQVRRFYQHKTWYNLSNMGILLPARNYGAKRDQPRKTQDPKDVWGVGGLGEGNLIVDHRPFSL
jgi:hypothetical protein